MEAKEIVKIINEAGRDGLSNNITCVSLYQVDEDGNNPIELESCSTMQPLVKIFTKYDKTQVDIDFFNDYDVDLRKIWDILQRFDECVDDISRNNTRRLPVLTLTIMPHNHGGKIYAMATNPIINVLTAEEPGRPVSVIRLLYDADDVGFYVAENMDLSDIDGDIEMEK